MERVILGLGSNIGDRHVYLKNAVDALTVILKDVILSSVYKTAPQDYQMQDDFFNLVLSGFYEKSAEVLLKETQKIERENGRNRDVEIPKGPRTLDIDILIFGKLILSAPLLTIPHPAIKRRAFVLVPLLELLPDLKEVDGTSFYKDALGDLLEQRVEKMGNLNDFF